MQKNYPKSLDLIRECISEVYPEGYKEDYKTIKFGKYDGTPIDELYHIDKNYCLHLVTEEWFERKYPEHFNYLVNIICADESLCSDGANKLYVLQFHDRDYLKIGITKQFLPKRLYGYKGVESIYREDNFNTEKSFYYLTEDEDIEDFLKLKLKGYRIGKSEKFRLESLPELLSLIDQKIDEGIYTYSWYPLEKILPFRDGFAYFNEFQLKRNEFRDFKNHYENFLISAGLFDRYED